MTFQLSRRQFGRMMMGGGAAALLSQLSRASAVAAPAANYRAMVGVFLFGGNDGWNMIVPTDKRFSGYSDSRGAIALPAKKVSPLAGANFALHPSMKALRGVWDEGALALVLNTGTLQTPLNKELYNKRPDLRPMDLMSHPDEQAHWQGNRARGINYDGFMGRLTDRTRATPIPPLFGFNSSSLAMVGARNAMLVFPSWGPVSRSAWGLPAGTDAAIEAFASGDGYGRVTATTASVMTDAYAANAAAYGVLSGSNDLDSYFVDPDTGAALTSDVSKQLRQVARLIQARDVLGQNRQTFFVSQGGYDTHAGQTFEASATGPHADLLRDLGNALAGFHKAMKALEATRNVTTFTMSDFGRTYACNAQLGTDHAWGNNHLVMGGAINARAVHGAYPSPKLGGADDMVGDGRFIPTTSQEEYLGAIALWHGVAAGDMDYVFPNWATWNTRGRGPLPLFRTVGGGVGNSGPPAAEI